MISSEAAVPSSPPPTGRQAAGGSQISDGPPILDAPPILDRSLVHIVMGSLDDAKAEDVTLIDLNGKTSIADAMVVTTGRSNVHVNAIADRVLRDIKAAGLRLPKVEGLVGGDWVLIDAGDVIVHVFRPEVRQFYNLEKMWGSDRPNAA